MSKRPTLKMRPSVGARTVVPDGAAEAIEARLTAREGGIQTPERPSVQTAQRGGRVATAAERPDAQTLGRPDSRIVARTGRLRADGTRTGARELRRSTIYLPPELAKRLDLYAVESGRDKSDVVREALAEWLAGRA